jgi:hypothetical protein
MSANQSRLELFIDVFGLKRQRALALPAIMPTDLVGAVLQEFRELEFLGDDPESYKIFKVLKDGNRSELDKNSPLEKQLAAQEQLVLVENIRPLPKDAKRPTQRVYLREQPMGAVHKLHWLPAIIGRHDAKQANNDLVAIDLSAHPQGLRISRRHAQISEDNGLYFLESLSSNPTLIVDGRGLKKTVETEKVPLQNGDTILLEHSQVALKFIIRDKDNA